VDASKFDQQIQNIQQRLAQLQQQGRKSGLQQSEPEITVEVFHELNTALEELQIAKEKLCQQNQEKAVASQTLEAERQHDQALFKEAPEVSLEQVSKALEAQEAQYRLLFANNPHPMWVYDAETLAFLAVNETATSYYGYSQEEFLAMTIRDIRPPEDVLALLETIPALTTELSRSEIYKHQKKDGTILDVEITSNPLIFAGRSAMLVLANDITERQEAQEALAKRERYLAALVEVQRRLLAYRDRENYYKEILEPLGEVSGASRIYIFENHRDARGELLMSQRGEWCKSGICPEIDNPILQNLSYDEFFPRWAEALAQGEIITGRVREFPEPERLILESQGILSILVLPLIVNGAFFGFIGFDNCKDARAWSAAEVDLLKAAAAAISQAQERKQAQEDLMARSRQAQLGADVGAALTERNTLSGMLHHCVESVVKHLDAALARIWLLNPTENMLELFASAGMYTRLDGSYARIPVGDYKVGLIAQQRQPYLTNEVLSDQCIGNKAWALQEGMIAFAGYPLIVEERLVGVIAMFARLPLTENTISALASIADEIALGIERKRTEEALRESEERFRATFEQAAVGIVHAGIDGKWLRVNKKLCDIVGYTSEELLGGAFQNITHPDDLNPDIKYVSQMLASEIQTYSIEKRYIRKDNSCIWINLTVSLVRDFSGSPKYFICVIKDITARKQAEESLRVQQEFLRQVIDTLPHLIFVKDENGKFILVNQGLANIYGTTIENLIGKSDADFNPNQEEVEQFLGDDRQVMDSLQEKIIPEEKVTDFTGKVNWFQTIKKPLISPEGTARQLLAIATNITPRKQAEEALRKSEELYRTLVSNFPNGAVLLFDHNLRYTLAEGLGLAEIGLTKENLPGKTIWEVFPPEMCNIVEPSYRAALAGATTVMEVPYANHFYMMHVLPVKNEQEEVLAGMVMTQNITEQKQAEAALQKAKDDLKIEVQNRTLKLCDTIDQLWHEIAERQRVENALRESEERFRNLVETTSNWVWEIDENAVYTYVNSKVQEILGYEPEAVLGKTPLDFMPPEQAQSVANFINSMASLQQPFIFLENIHLHKDGHIVIVETSGVPFYDAEGQFKGYRGVNRDITLRKQAEKALRESEERFRLLAENSTDMISRHTPDGIYLYVSPACYTLLGYKPEEMIGHSAYEFLHPDDVVVLAQNQQNILDDSDIYTIAFRSRHRNGHYIWLESTARSVRDAQTGAVNEIHVASRDITERKRAEADIQKALLKEKQLNELKSNFVSMTSHEFRTPLTIILSSAQLIENYGHKWTEEKKRTYLQRIKIGGKRITQLLDDILVVGKADAGKLQLEPAPLNLVEFCHSLVEEMQLGDRSQHTIEFINQADYPDACMDEKLLQRILYNLLSNALKYSPSGSIVRFELTHENEMAVFKVQDQGIGIPEADQKHLFDSFQRASNVGTIPGTGLGLAIVKKCVDLQGGAIAVSSEVGVGTLITVRLPLVQGKSSE
jgi:hypothetical protein